jgi:MSHA biogenesis protein MshO
MNSMPPCNNRGLSPVVRVGNLDSRWSLPSNVLIGGGNDKLFEAPTTLQSRKYPRLHPRSCARGFTLLEAIVVIVITGIISAIVAVFIKSPVDSYFDSARRAELTDVADTAVRRMARDIHLALPNSVRNPFGGDQCLEYIPTKIGGRYRTAPGNTGAGGPPEGDALDFTFADPSFDMLWRNSALPAAEQIGPGDVVVVYNDGSITGNAYAGKNAIQVAVTPTEPGAPADRTFISFVGIGTAVPFDLKRLPSESPANRFQVIPAGEHVVAFTCAGANTVGGNGVGTLVRNARTLTGEWSRPADCPAMTSGATSALLAQNVSACSLKYDPPGSSTGLSRFGILSISLEITKANESVKLYHQIHVDNTP